MMSLQALHCNYDRVKWNNIVEERIKNRRTPSQYYMTLHYFLCRYFIHDWSTTKFGIALHFQRITKIVTKIISIFWARNVMYKLEFGAHLMNVAFFLTRTKIGCECSHISFSNGISIFVHNKNTFFFVSNCWISFLC